MKTRLKILVIGLGSIAAKHIAAIRSLDFAADIAVLSRTDGSGRQASANTLVVEKRFASWDEVRAFAPDFALICSPTAMHVSDALILAEMGIPFLIEKPVSCDLHHVEGLLAKVEAKALLTYVACQLRFDPLIMAIKKGLQAGSWPQPQRVRVYCSSYLPDWRFGRDYRKVYSASRALGGGVALDLIHEIDYVLWWLGEPRRVTGFRAKVSALEIDSDDTCVAVLAYAGCLVEISLSYAEKNEARGFELYFQDFILTGDLLKGTLVCQAKGQSEVIGNFIRDREALFQEQMKHFIECVIHRTKSRNTLCEGIAALRVVTGLEWMA